MDLKCSHESSEAGEWLLLQWGDWLVVFSAVKDGEPSFHFQFQGRDWCSQQQSWANVRRHFALIATLVCNEASLLRQVRGTALHGFTAVFAILDSNVGMIREAGNCRICRYAQDACSQQLKVLR